MFNNRPAIKDQLDTTDTLLDGNNSKDINSDVYLIRDRVQRRLLNESNGEINQIPFPQMRQKIETLFNQVIVEENLIYTRNQRANLLEWVVFDILGYGPLEPLLQDPTITEVMCNGPHDIYIERNGTIEQSDVVFENDAHLLRIIHRIVAPLGRRIDESSPMVDARLPSGYRVNATIAPLSLTGPLLTIRKFAATPFTAQDMIANATLTPNLVAFLKACVEARVNVIISGGTGSGKTTLLNVISAFIPSQERVITIEDTAELQLKQKHVLRLEKRPPNIEGKGEITIRQLVINSLRMRPDRIIVGEARGAEALDMLQAMNTGHDGSMTTIHANSTHHVLTRLDTMVLMSGVELPIRAIREQIAGAINIIVHTARLSDGSRKVLCITQVLGLKDEEKIEMKDIFVFKQTGTGADGKVIGAFKPTGFIPTFIEDMRLRGIDLPPTIFKP